MMQSYYEVNAYLLRGEVCNNSTPEYRHHSKTQGQFVESLQKRIRRNEWLTYDPKLKKAKKHVHCKHKAGEVEKLREDVGFGYLSSCIAYSWHKRIDVIQFDCYGIAQSKREACESTPEYRQPSTAKRPIFEHNHHERFLLQPSFIRDLESSLFLTGFQLRNSVEFFTGIPLRDEKRYANETSAYRQPHEY